MRHATKRHDVLDRIIDFVENLLTSRYLKGLSEEDREKLFEDFEFIRETLIDQRPPRVAVVGSRDSDLVDLLGAITGGRVGDHPEVKEYLGYGRWYDYEIDGAILELLDLRSEGDQPPPDKALIRDEPDLVLFPWSYTDEDRDASEEAGEEEFVDPHVQHLEDIVRETQNISGHTPAVVAVIDDETLAEGITPNRADRILRGRLRRSHIPNTQFSVVLRSEERDLVAEMLEATPMEARLQFAQIAWTAESKRRLAKLIVRATAGVAAALATVPLPVADMVPITGVQMVMIASVAHLSGRDFAPSTVGEFVVAMGVNVGAGYALREVARALVQIIPFAGSAISAGIATGATFALGNAAISYFIDDEEPEVEPPLEV